MVSGCIQFKLCIIPNISGVDLCGQDVHYDVVYIVYRNSPVEV